MFWIIVTGAVFALILWHFYIKPYKYWKSMGVLQTRPWIFLGDSWPSIFRTKNVTEWMEWIYYMYPESKFTGMYQFYRPILMVKDPEIIREIAVKDFDYFTDHNNFAASEEVDPMWSNNLFALKGQRWRDMRSLISGTFTSSKMRLMYGLISEESEKFSNYLLKTNKDFEEVEMKDKFTRYTNDVIASTAFGLKVDSFQNPNNEFFQLGKEISNFRGVIVWLKYIGVVVCPWLLKLLNIGFLSKRVMVYFKAIIDDTIKAREKQGIVRPDMINLLLEFRRGVNKTEEKDIPDSGFAVVRESSETAKPLKKQIEVTNMDIVSQAVVFFLAGFDSVASAMCFTCYELAVNPDIQDKLRKEVKDTFDKTNGKPSYEDILGMKYMDMVLTESLRKWPIAPVTDRVCVKPYTLNSTNSGDPTVTFRKSDTIWIPIYNIHHDPQYYPDPKRFIPERFSEENRGQIKPYTYMPFGVGPRACIGSRFALLEVKSVLFHLINNFEIVPTEKTSIPLIISKTAINFTPERGFLLGLKRIQITSNIRC